MIRICSAGVYDPVEAYYFAGASRIAVRTYVIPQSSTLTYLAGDHLGSTSLAVDASTGDVIQTRYKAWGEVRYTTPNKTLPTRFTFTGQYSHVSDEATDLGAAGFGLMFYQSRFYDPVLGRFSQADTVVPGGVQGLDRYAYAANSPVVYVDPSGHAQHRSDYQNQIHAKKLGNAVDWKKELEDRFSWTAKGNWANAQLEILYKTALFIELAVGKDTMMQILGNVTFKLVTNLADSNGKSIDGTIDGKNIVELDSKWGTDPTKGANAMWEAAHELGHIWDARNDWKLGKGLQETVHSTYPALLHGRNGNVFYYGSSGNSPGATGWPVTCPNQGCKNWDTWDELSGWNRLEDFAQSFAAYIFPSVAIDKLKRNYGITSYGPGFSSFYDTSRGQYIDACLQDVPSCL